MEFNNLLNTDFIGIIAGTDNRISSAYMEAANEVKDNDSALQYLKNFTRSMDNIAKKSNVKDPKISESKGDIQKYHGYEDIKKVLGWMKYSPNGGSTGIIKDTGDIFTSLEKNREYYVKAYDRNINLLIYEYENSVYMLDTALSLVLLTTAESMEAGKPFKFLFKVDKEFGATTKLITKLSKEISSKNHADYLKGMIEFDSKKDSVVKESYDLYSESPLADTWGLIGDIFHGVYKGAMVGVSLVQTIKKSLFGIIPLCRSIFYIRYRRKANKILKLEDQVSYIEQNIEQLKLMNNMNPERKAIIIKKQEAYIKAYQKKAERLRAELIEGDKAADQSIAQENPQMSAQSDDDFVLEGYSLSDIFGDNTNFTNPQIVN